MVNKEHKLKENVKTRDWLFIVQDACFVVPTINSAYNLDMVPYFVLIDEYLCMSSKLKKK